MNTTARLPLVPLRLTEDASDVVPDDDTPTTITVGDVCRLRSGSPLMTVIAQDGDGDAVTTSWFTQGNLGGVLVEQSFPRAALRRVEKEE